MKFVLRLALWKYLEIWGKGTSHDIFLPTFHCRMSEVGIFNSLFCQAVVSLLFQADYTQGRIICWDLSLAQRSGMQFDI